MMGLLPVPPNSRATRRNAAADGDLQAICDCGKVGPTELLFCGHLDHFFGTARDLKSPAIAIRRACPQM
jgi:hypothetical protein